MNAARERAPAWSRKASGKIDTFWNGRNSRGYEAVIIKIPKIFSRRVIELHGRVGIEWLSRLPSMLDECSERWSLAIEPPFEPLSYNYVAPATLPDGHGVVLKVGVPNPELLTEIEALQIFNGRGSVRLLDARPEQGILLLERLKPGESLTAVSDNEKAISVAVRVMKQLWRPAPAQHSFPTVRRWASGLERLRKAFDGGSGPFPKELVNTAETLFAELIPSSHSPMLLHGDLHHSNILSAEREPWLALDPKGVIGEAAYEVGALLRNPIPQLLDAPQPKRILARRVDQMAEALGFDRERLLGWGISQAVLSAWWSFEDHGYGWEPAIACAEHLTTLVK
ncbi:MAG TPA: phosphotransferase [Anaerolineae bacterium]|nr:phosphotransferase [Anaerolineae bacterium]